jgi:ubiquinone/menaquinone biosynthesis C-methylase UbiE
LKVWFDQGAVLLGWYSRVLVPRIVDLVMSNRILRSQRQALLAKASGEVLEIGFGTGLNLPHYPAAVQRLTVVDPNPGMARRAARRLETASRPILQHLGTCESLPLPDAGFDTVVSTWTLCSIGPIDRALREVLRVLRPGGLFLFVEHGLSPDPSVARWQRRLTPVHKRLADGCHLDRDIRALVAASGLQIQALDQFYLEQTPKILGYTTRGAAVRPADQLSR